MAAALLGTAFVMLRRRQGALEKANADLARERERVHFALEGASLTIWDWDIASDAVWLNANWKEMLGERPAETRTSMQALVGLVHPDDIGRVRTDGIAMLKGTAERFDDEYRIRGAEGSWRWIRTRGMVTVRGASGRALRASGTNADVTSRKLAEKSLAESEARFRALTELSSDLYWEQDEQFHLVSWSAPAWARWRNPDLPRPALQAPELTEADWGEHRAVLEARQAFRDLEIRQVAPDGRQSWLSVGAVPVTDEHGKFRGYRGLARVITDRKLAEQRLRKSESQFRQLVEFMPAAIVLVGQDRRAVVHNKAYAELLGLRGEEIDGRLVREVLGEERFAVVEPHLERALEGEPTHYSTYRDAAGGRRDRPRRPALAPAGRRRRRRGRDRARHGRDASQGGRPHEGPLRVGGEPRAAHAPHRDARLAGPAGRRRRGRAALRRPSRWWTSRCRIPTACGDS